MPSDVSHRNISLSDLQKHCAEETSHFYRGLYSEAWHCYELFRRAVVEKQEAAWEYLVKQYENQVQHWVEQHPQYRNINENAEVFVTQAFVKFWQRNFSAAEFSRFPNIKRIMAYLKTCVGSVILDFVRVQNRKGIVIYLEELYKDPSGWQIPHLDQVEKKLEEVDFWEEIRNQLEDDLAYRVIFSSFVLNLKPVEIFDLEPKVFDGVDEVYRIKAKAMNTLSRKIPEIGDQSYFSGLSE